jgi:glycosyltransferase involved in cell wall biosynthesis
MQMQEKKIGSGDAGDRETLACALSVMKTQKVALFVVAYRAEKYIAATLARIPVELRAHFAEIFIIDDASADKTFETARAFVREARWENATVMRTPRNRGYGGNQKIGYTYALEQDFDIVVLLHGDGQYPPERLASIVAEFDDERFAAVFGSRMLEPRRALAGGMPLYKWIGNRVLTRIENVLLGSHLSEFHSGYRAYRCAALRCIDFLGGSDDFHFDTEIIIRLLARGFAIREVSMPTHYGDEECHVNSVCYAWNCIASVVRYRFHPESGASLPQGKRRLFTNTAAFEAAYTATRVSIGETPDARS